MATTTFHAPGTVYQPIAARPAIGAAIAEKVRQFFARARFAKDYAVMEAITDHQLKDIGLTRGDVYRITRTGL